MAYRIYLKCLVQDCISNSVKNIDRTFYKLPRDDERKNKWLEALNILPTSLSKKRYHVCDIHFVPDDHSITTLKKSAVPSLHLSESEFISNVKPITFNWTDRDDENLLTMIIENGALWDTTKAEYRDTLKKQRIYINISTYFKGTTPSDIEKRFTSLKEKYRREKKKVETTTYSGYSASYLKEWHLMPKMQLIMDKVMKPRKIISIDPQPQSHISQDEDVIFSEENSNPGSPNVTLDLSSSSESPILFSSTKTERAKCPTFTHRTNKTIDKFFEEGTKTLERISQSAESIVSVPKLAEKPNHFKVFEFMAEECNSMDPEKRNKFTMEVMDVFWKYKLN